MCFSKHDGSVDLLNQVCHQLQTHRFSSQRHLLLIQQIREIQGLVISFIVA